MTILTLISHLVLVFILLAIIFRQSWGRAVVNWLGGRAVNLGVLVSLAAVLGSLYYSNILGFDPCVLCWWQRIFIFPQLVLFLTAFKYKDVNVFRYTTVLAIIASLFSLYHLYIQAGGGSILPCPIDVSCTKLYVLAFGYISIPAMALTTSLYILILAWVRKIYENRNA